MNTAFIFWLGNSTLPICIDNLTNKVQLRLCASHLLLIFLHTQLNVPCNQVAYISYNMGTRGLPDIYTFALWPVALGTGCIYRITGNS